MELTMSAQARAFDYYNYGSTAPARELTPDFETRRIAVPAPKREPAKHIPVKERMRRLERAGTAAVNKRVPGISFLAVVGALMVSVLMVFVVLAQISLNEAAAEAAKTSIRLRELTEKHRTLELAFESSFDIQEVERYARDELGMSRPDAAQTITISSASRDRAMVLDEGEDRGSQGFGAFLRSLTEYFRQADD